MEAKVDLDGYCTPEEYLVESSMIGSLRDRRKIMKAASELMDGERARTMVTHARCTAGSRRDGLRFWG